MGGDRGQSKKGLDAMDSTVDFILKAMGSYEGINQSSDKIRCLEKVFLAAMWRMEWRLQGGQMGDFC